MLRPAANILTIARLIAVAPFTVLLATSADGRNLGAAAIFVAASLTDYLDGALARRAHRPSAFGRIADPLADRLLINMALVLLWHAGRLPWWLAAPVLTRDVWLILLFGARHTGSRVEVNQAGKAGTALIMLSLALIMVTSAAWPLAIYVAGLALSLAAAALYALVPRQAA